MPLKDAAFDYGAPVFRTDNPRLAWCPFDGNLFCLPLVSVLEPETDTGLSLVLSPEDTSARADPAHHGVRPVYLHPRLSPARCPAAGQVRHGPRRSRGRLARPLALDDCPLPAVLRPAQSAGPRHGGHGRLFLPGRRFRCGEDEADGLPGELAGQLRFSLHGHVPAAGGRQRRVWTRFGGQKTSLPAMRRLRGENAAVGLLCAELFQRGPSSARM